MEEKGLRDEGVVLSVGCLMTLKSLNDRAVENCTEVGYSHCLEDNRLDSDR